MNVLVSLPIAASVPVSAPAIAATPTDDPVFAMIERHKEISAAYDLLVNDNRVGDSYPGHCEINAACDRLRRELIDYSCHLYRSLPTSSAGIAALARYVAALDEWQLPGRPEGEREDNAEAEDRYWVSVFCETAARAAEALAPASAPGLVLAAPAGADPVFSAIAKYRICAKSAMAAYAMTSKLHDEAEKAGVNEVDYATAKLGVHPDKYTDGPAFARWEALDDVFASPPTTTAGILAMLDFADEMIENEDRDLVGENLEHLIASMKKSAKALLAA